MCDLLTFEIPEHLDYFMRCSTCKIEVPIKRGTVRLIHLGIWENLFGKTKCKKCGFEPEIFSRVNEEVKTKILQLFPEDSSWWTQMKPVYPIEINERGIVTW